MNKVILHGRLARDPELRYTGSGKPVGSFTLAVNRRNNGQNSNQPTADFIPCIAWEKLAETICNNFVKGSEMLVHGRIQVRSYDGQDGSKKYATEVVVNEMDFCGRKTDNGAAASTPENNPGGFGGQLVSDDDIPF